MDEQHSDGGHVMPGPALTMPSLIAQVENWGYYLLPPSHSACPGYTGLLVALRAEPTGKHFDPETVALQVRGPHGHPEELVLDRTPDSMTARRVFPGMVKLTDRRGKVVEFFTFGGWLELGQHAQETIVSLRSPAPVLPILSDPESVAGQLVAEVEVQLNGLRAEAGAHRDELEKRLAALEPQVIYAAVMRSLIEKYGSAHSLQTTFPNFYRMLMHETEWLAGHHAWEPNGARLADLLRDVTP